MSHACSVLSAPRPRPRFDDTSTPEALAEIAAASRAVEDARDVLAQRIRERDEVLRRHYAAGVDVRDLVRATSAGGTLVPVSRGHASRLVSGTPRVTDQE